MIDSLREDITNFFYYNSSQRSATGECLVTNPHYTTGNNDSSQTATISKGTFIDAFYACKITKFVERRNSLVVFKAITDTFHSSSFFYTQFTIIICIPVCYTNGFYIVIIKDDIVGFRLYYD